MIAFNTESLIISFAHLWSVLEKDEYYFGDAADTPYRMGEVKDAEKVLAWENSSQWLKLAAETATVRGIILQTIAAAGW